MNASYNAKDVRFQLSISGSKISIRNYKCKTHQTLHFFLPSLLDHQKTPPDLSETKQCAETSTDGEAQLLPGSCGRDLVSTCIKITRKTTYDKKKNNNLNANIVLQRDECHSSGRKGIGSVLHKTVISVVFSPPLVSSNYHLCILRNK